MKNKKNIVIIFIISIIIITTIFIILYYKNCKNGNTMFNKSEEEIINYILDMKSYKAKLEITVETNKKLTHYIVSQIFENNNAKQEVLEPSNIAGVITEYDGTNIKIRNNKLDLETTFQNYQYIVENTLWLDSFIKDYKNEKNVTSTIQNNEIILKVKKDQNRYNVYKELYIDKRTAKPTKMIVKDINQKTLVYILYTEMEIL